MRLLLDTHIWLWALLDPTRLRPEVAAAVAEAANELWLSPISVWEALLLAERGRIVVTDEPPTWIRALLQGFPVREAPLTREVAIASRDLDLEHEDPADRFIAASAVVHELTLVTEDDRLRRSGTIPLLGNGRRRGS